MFSRQHVNSELFKNAPTWVSRPHDSATGLLNAHAHGDCRVLLHEDLNGFVADNTALNEKRRTVLHAALEGKRKRLVIGAVVNGQALVFKYAFAHGWGKTLQGICTSGARIEHGLHTRAHKLGLSLVPSLGYLEYRTFLRIHHAVHIQPNYAEAMRVGSWRFVTDRIQEQPIKASIAFAKGLAHTHQLGFFHADLKAFHVLMGNHNNPELRFMDFGRVSFRVTPRRRTINLYQALRFIIPETQHNAFMETYAQHCGYSVPKNVALKRQVHSFLAHKLKTHPHPNL